MNVRKRKKDLKIAPLKSKSKKKWRLRFLFLLGLAVMLYPIISQLFYRIEANRQISSFDQQVATLSKEGLDNRFKLAQAFNSTLSPGELQDPFSKEEKQEGVSEYGKMLLFNEKIGYVDIPKINQEIPMYVGTSDKVLEKGVGLLEGTSLPVGGSSTHTVIAGHRGLPSAKLFTNLDKMKQGDVFYLHVLDKILAYQVDKISVVGPSDFTPVLIENGKDYATLLTCTPYMINSHRLLVRGHRIPYTDPKSEVNHQLQESSHRYLIFLAISFVCILLLIYIILKKDRDLRRISQELDKFDDK